jgi:hypothetical protein
MAEGLDKNTVLQKLDEIKIMATKNPNLISDNIFHGMTYLAELLLEAGKAKTHAKIGGGPSTPIEKGLKIFMRGGDSRPSLIPSVGASIVLPEGYADSLKDISIDRTYEAIKNKIAELDEANTKLADVVGPRVYLNEQLKEGDLMVGPFPPYVPTKIPIPKNTIIPFITYTVEALKLMVTVGPLKSDFTRKILSISLAVFDVMNGEWKKGVMSLLGLFGETPSLIGSVGRNFLTIWNYIAPDIRNDLVDNIFDASKSLISGFWLNMISTFAPEEVRNIINKVLDKLRPLSENFNSQIETIQERARSKAATLGYRLEFPKLPFDKVPSADDLINLITILRTPAVMCSSEMWGAVQPLLDTPVLKILLELFLIPTSLEDHTAKCQGVSTDLVKAAEDAMRNGTQRLPLPKSPQQ